MTEQEFKDRIEKEYPNQYFFVTVVYHDLIDYTLDRVYAYQKRLIDPEHVHSFPPLSIARLFEADYALFDNKVKKDKTLMFGDQNV